MYVPLRNNFWEEFHCRNRRIIAIDKRLPQTTIEQMWTEIKSEVLFTHADKFDYITILSTHADTEQPL